MQIASIVKLIALIIITKKECTNYTCDYRFHFYYDKGDET